MLVAPRMMLMRLCRLLQWENSVWLVGLVAALVGLGVGSALNGFDESMVKGVTARFSLLGDKTAPVYSRIITFTPALTEIVYALDQGHRVVGTSSFVTYPTDAALLPRVGGIVDPNLELITQLDPDLILTQGVIPGLESIRGGMSAHVENLSIETLDELYETITQIGSLLACPADAKILTLRLRLELAEVAKMAGKRAVRKVFICLGRDPGRAARLFTTGRGSFISEIVSIAGGVNVFQELGARYREVSGEEVLARTPDVVLDFGGGWAAERSMTAVLAAWQSLFPRESVRIVVITEDYVLYPGPRLGLLARTIADSLSEECR